MHQTTESISIRPEPFEVLSSGGFSSRPSSRSRSRVRNRLQPLLLLLLQQHRLILLHQLKSFVLARGGREAIADFGRDDAPAVGFVLGDGLAQAVDLIPHKQDVSTKVLLLEGWFMDEWMDG